MGTRDPNAGTVLQLGRAFFGTSADQMARLAARAAEPWTLARECFVTLGARLCGRLPHDIWLLGGAGGGGGFHAETDRASCLHASGGPWPATVAGRTCGDWPGLLPGSTRAWRPALHRARNLYNLTLCRSMLVHLYPSRESGPHPYRADPDDGETGQLLWNLWRCLVARADRLTDAPGLASYDWDWSAHEAGVAVSRRARGLGGDARAVARLNHLWVALRRTASPAGYDDAVYRAYCDFWGIADAAASGVYPGPYQCAGLPAAAAVPGRDRAATRCQPNEFLGQALAALLTTCGPLRLAGQWQPEWAAAHGGRARSLARHIYAAARAGGWSVPRCRAAWADAPVLADMLEDAGCDYAELLDDLRHGPSLPCAWCIDGLHDAGSLRPRLPGGGPAITGPDDCWRCGGAGFFYLAGDRPPGAWSLDLVAGVGDPDWEAGIGAAVEAAAGGSAALAGGAADPD